MGTIVMSKSFVTATNKRLEDLLPWWYDNMRRLNPTISITIADIGMSPTMCEWARQKADTFIQYDETVSIDGWFMKPSIILDTPYTDVCWVDLDCEVLKPCEDIFEYGCDNKLALTKDLWKRRDPNWPEWATGVIVVKGKPAILKEWTKFSLERIDRGDQNALERVLNTPLYSYADITEMPQEYQWLRMELKDGIDSPHKKIMHWSGPTGKDHIRKLPDYKRSLLTHGFNYGIIGA
jgi:hypothetical protein